jgi:hypothetical protein
MNIHRAIFRGPAILDAEALAPGESGLAFVGNPTDRGADNLRGLKARAEGAPLHRPNLYALRSPRLRPDCTGATFAKAAGAFLLTWRARSIRTNRGLARGHWECHAGDKTDQITELVARKIVELPRAEVEMDAHL